MALNIESLFGHTFALLIVCPAFLMVVSVIMGGLLAGIEGWACIEGVLYIGGGLSFVVLSAVVPTSSGGIVADFIMSCLSLGLFTWFFSLVGTMPFCQYTVDALTSSSQRLPAAGRSLHILVMYIVLVMPAVGFLVGLPMSGLLALVEGISFQGALGHFYASLMHAPAVRPNEPVGDFGRILNLIIAFMSITLVLGWSVGVLLLIPAMNSLQKALAKLSDIMGKATIAKQLLHYFLVVVIIMPLVLLPIVLALGAILAECEDWDIMDGTLYIAGNIFAFPLTNALPSSSGGQAFALIMSFLGVMIFSIVIATVATLTSVSSSASLLGLCHEGLLRS